MREELPNFSERESRSAVVVAYDIWWSRSIEKFPERLK